MTLTTKEENQFYGTPPIPGEVEAAIERHAKAFDSDDLEMIAFDNGEEILAALRANSGLSIIGYTLQESAKQLIADRVSIELFGKHGMVKASEVTL